MLDCLLEPITALAAFFVPMIIIGIFQEIGDRMHRK